MFGKQIETGKHFIEKGKNAAEDVGLFLKGMSFILKNGEKKFSNDEKIEFLLNTEKKFSLIPGKVKLLRLVFTDGEIAEENERKFLNPIPSMKYKKIDYKIQKKLTFGGIVFDGKEIYISSNFKRPKNSLEREELVKMKAFKLLAKYLSETDVVPDRIRARSWILGRKKTLDKIGFTEVKKFDFDPLKNGIEMWGQFIDVNGKFKKEELEYLFQNNEPRYKVTAAYISFEDFMQKYGNQFLDRDFQIEFDFSDEQEDILKKNQIVIDNYFKNLIISDDWFSSFYDTIKDLPFWSDVLDTEKGKLFLQKIKQIIDVSTVDELKKKIHQVEKDINFESFMEKKQEEFLISRNEIKTVFIPKKTTITDT